MPISISKYSALQDKHVTLIGGYVCQISNARPSESMTENENIDLQATKICKLFSYFQADTEIKKKM